MKKLLGWIILLLVVVCLAQYLRAVASATAFNTFLQEQADRLAFQNPEKVEEAIFARADEAGIYLGSDDLQVLATAGGSGTVWARYVVPVHVPGVTWELERTFSTEQ
jgi:hypothetical protein